MDLDEISHAYEPYQRVGDNDCKGDKSGWRSKVWDRGSANCKVDVSSKKLHGRDHCSLTKPQLT
jgi:hypothetical protein